MGTFDLLIDKLDADDRVKGHQFERIAKWFLINDPTYINRGVRHICPRGAGSHSPERSPIR